MARVFHLDIVHRAPPDAAQCEAVHAARDAGVDAQAVQCGLHAQNVLAHIHKRPGGGAGQPAVLGLAKSGGVAAGHHLAVNIRLGAVHLADGFQIGRAGLFIDCKGAVPMPQHRFGTADPGVVVAEDTGVFFVARRVACDLAKFQVIPRVGGLQQHDAVLCIQALLHAFERLFGLAALYADARHDAESLRFNVDLPFLVLAAADGLAAGIVSAAEPRAVPPGVKDHGGHFAGRVTRGVRLVAQANVRAGIRPSLAVCCGPICR